MDRAPVGPAPAGDDPDAVVKELEKRFHGFPVPSGPFDPVSASRVQLKTYGLPPKPDPATQPLLRGIWDRGFGAKLTLEEFRFTPRVIEQITKPTYRLQFRQADELPVALTRFETSPNWSGAYITANRDRQFLQIWGAWAIPSNLKLPPPEFRGPAGVGYRCANWIGLDGQRLYFNSSLPQIGTVSVLQADGTTAAGAWTQWWARGLMNPVPTPLNLAVAPGDQVLCVLTAVDPQTVIFVMVDLDQKTCMAVQATAPPAVPMPPGVTRTGTPDIAGATAEWILERPAVPGQTNAYGQPQLYNFPDYRDTAFDFCGAVEGESVDISSLPGGLPRELQAARRIRMFDVLLDPGRTAFISMPWKLDDTSVHLRYGGFR